MKLVLFAVVVVVGGRIVVATIVIVHIVLVLVVVTMRAAAAATHTTTTTPSLLAMGGWVGRITPTTRPMTTMLGGDDRCRGAKPASPRHPGQSASTGREFGALPRGQQVRGGKAFVIPRCHELMHERHGR
jgi:hypothetical protein